MRFLPISILFLLITSCSLQTTKNLIVKEVSHIEVDNPYFSNTYIDYIYKAKIDIYGRKFGGILIIKKIDENSHRVVFTTEFGNKLFDFLFENDTVINNFVIEELDKKFIVNTLRNDFKLLVSEKNKVLNQFDSGLEDIYKTIDGKQFNFYFINKKSHTLDKITRTSKSKVIVEVLFSNVESVIANSILIHHKNIKLNIALELFKKD
jgi:hypothetical protein|tara:strand:+ start:292 stop:912 length:621 start_codon:yes stop_codon:yes gene_type:complete